jgi:hypothetical protein
MSLLDKPLIVYTVLAYLAVVLVIGVWSGRRTRNPRDFFIAGQRIGLVVTGLATMSAAFSGFVFLGGPGLTYRIGLASLLIVLPLGFTAGMLCWVLGRRLRALAAVREIYTVPDAVQARYGSRTVTGLAALAVLLGTVAYLGLQIQALGILLRSIFGTESIALAMLAGLGVLVIYSVVGGMVAGVYTDLVQGALMMLAAVAVFAQAFAAGGGWGRRRGEAEMDAVGAGREPGRLRARVARNRSGRTGPRGAGQPGAARPSRRCFGNLSPALRARGAGRSDLRSDPGGDHVHGRFVRQYRLGGARARSPACPGFPAA